MSTSTAAETVTQQRVSTARVSLRTDGLLARAVNWYARRTYGMEVERKALAYAEAMTATPPTVTDEMVAGLRDELTDAQVVELTSMISVENIRSRTSFALGLTSQGFRAQCDLPQSAAQPRSA